MSARTAEMLQWMAFWRHTSRFRGLRVELAPQVGLEPTTLRLTVIGLIKITAVNGCVALPMCVSFQRFAVRGRQSGSLMNEHHYQPY